MDDLQTTQTAPQPQKVPTTVVNTDYFKRLPGCLHTLELILGLVCWALIIAWSTQFSGYRFVYYPCIVAWVVTLIFLIVILFDMDLDVVAKCPWTFHGFHFHLFWGVVYFISACVLFNGAVYYHSNLLGLSAGFGFLTSMVYIARGLVGYKEQKGLYPWQKMIAVSNDTDEQLIVPD